MYSQTFKEVFPKNLNRYLTQYNMSQHELARRLNVSATAVNNWCTGVKAPRMDKVDKMCRIFHCRRSDLVEPYQDETECYTVIDKRIKEIGEKIKERRLELHMTQEDLAERMGYKGKSSINKIEKGSQDIPLSKVEEFARVLHTTPAALMGWDDIVTPVDLSDTISIPVYGRIPAGVPRRCEEYVDEHIQVPRSWTTGGQELAGLRVSGESMLPLIQDGDLVVYQYQPDIESGSIGICRIDGDDATVKKVIKQEPHTVILQPLNPAFQPIIFTGDATEPTLEIIGKVIEVRHRL